MDSFQGLTPKSPSSWHRSLAPSQIFNDHVNPATKRTIDQSASGKLRDKNAKESWALLEDLALYDNERIVKNVEVHIGRLNHLDDFYVIDMDKDPVTSLLVGRGFLATTNAVIDYKKAKIAVGEGVTRSIFRVNEIDLGEEELPY
ncbi:MAK10-like protein [Tanacetum coccineum]